MTLPLRSARLSAAALAGGLLITAGVLGFPSGEPKSDACWQVDDVRVGMKGTGRTVVYGTKVESFDVEILGVLKNTSPGRDMVLGRLSGLNLDKTGVIAGMSGSPVYIDGKLLGAVAYAWSFGKEPIAGITPFTQMHGYAVAQERGVKDKPTRVRLPSPILADERPFQSVTVSAYPPSADSSDDGLWMTPLRTPLVATGITAHTLSLLRQRGGNAGWLPVQGGGAGRKVMDEQRDVALEPGGPLAVALIRGDFDLSGMGTVTHIDGKRVYGWGHPFMTLGDCELPLMTGYVHAVYPRQTVSFKIGSPLKTVGVITADVSTGIAGWLDRTCQLLPMRMSVRRWSGEETKTFYVEIVKERSLMPNLVFTALTNSVDMEGDLPEEMTADLTARIEIEGRPPIVIQDTYSGASYSGGRAPQALYHHLAALVQALAYNPFEPVHFKQIDCDTSIREGRRTAEIDTVELASEVISPGETLKAIAFLQPYKGKRERVEICLALPKDFPEGAYTATLCDEPTAVRARLRDNPLLSNPDGLDRQLQALRLQTAARRTNLALRVAMPAAGVAVDGKAYPDLPPSMMQVLGTGRRTGAELLGTDHIARQPTEWVVQGSESVRFAVVKNKKRSELVPANSN